MRILLLATSFNSLTQRLFVELRERGHDLSVEFDVNDAVVTEAAKLWRPEVVIAPYLRRAIPANVHRRVPCLVVHPGPIGDRGPSALDWAILEGRKEWGVTVIEATEELDAGPVLAHRTFVMRAAAKSSLYRNEVTEAAVAAVLEALGAFERRAWSPRGDYGPPGVWRPRVAPDDRRIDWSSDTTESVLRKVRSADGQPGTEDEILGLPCKLHDIWPESKLRGSSGAIIARRDGAICRATRDGAVWIGHLKPLFTAPDERPFKLPAALALVGRLDDVPIAPWAPSSPNDLETYREIAYQEADGIGWLSFDFYNGAMSVDQCRRLLEAFRYALSRPTKVLVLAGGREFWSNGMNLNVIEAASSPADESWANINAIDDIAQAVLLTDSKVTISVMAGNAGAGGVFLALGADHVVARDGIVFNAHYKNMGNLYGSEYWTYVLPRRIGRERADAVMAARLPMGMTEARRMNLVDVVLPNERAAFHREARLFAKQLARDRSTDVFLSEKKARIAREQAERPLDTYRAAELARMRLNFYGFDPSYHVARWRFVTKELHARTPLHLARHRQALA